MDGIRKFRTMFCLWNSLSSAKSGREYNIPFPFLKKREDKKIENILNRIFILLPRSCPGVGLQGAGGVKNFSVGICDGAPSTVRYGFVCYL